jgi:hypothetical protein
MRYTVAITESGHHSVQTQTDYLMVAVARYVRAVLAGVGKDVEITLTDQSPETVGDHPAPRVIAYATFRKADP